MEEGVVGDLPSINYDEVEPTGFIERDFVGEFFLYINIKFTKQNHISIF